MEEQNEVTPEEAAEVQELAENPIITPADPARWPLLEVPSQACNFPLTKTDFEQLEKMNGILVELGDEAAGLAAVQVGYPRQIFLLNESAGIRAFINPRIIAKSRETKKDVEGCLSVPSVPVYIPRPKTLTLEYYDIDGERHEETFSGFWARAICHEIDHLNGILIIQRADEAGVTQVPMRAFKSQSGFMKLTPHRRKAVATRRRRNKDARRARRQHK